MNCFDFLSIITLFLVRNLWLTKFFQATGFPAPGLVVCRCSCSAPGPHVPLGLQVSHISLSEVSAVVQFPQGFPV